MLNSFRNKTLLLVINCWWCPYHYTVGGQNPPKTISFVNYSLAISWWIRPADAVKDKVLHDEPANMEDDKKWKASISSSLHQICPSFNIRQNNMPTSIILWHIYRDVGNSLTHVDQGGNNCPGGVKTVTIKKYST